MKCIKPPSLIKLAILYWCVGVFYSCNTKLEIELPDPEPKLVLNALITPFTPPYSSNFRVQLFPNYPILDTTKSTQITDALVLWFQNEILIDTLTFNTDHKGYTLPFFYFPEVGQDYSIQVSKEGFLPIKASNSIPNKVEIDTVITSPLAGLNNEMSAYSSIAISFIDPKDEENYYEIIVSRIGEANEGAYKLWTSEQIITEEPYYPSDLSLDKENPRRLLFSDAKINGNKKTIVVYYEPPQSEDPYKRWITRHIIDIYLRSVTQEYYKHFTSVLLHQNSREGDLFYGIGEPMNAYTNVENGYGILAGYHNVVRTELIDTATVYIK